MRLIVRRVDHIEETYEETGNGEACLHDDDNQQNLVHCEMQIGQMEGAARGFYLEDEVAKVRYADKQHTAGNRNHESNCSWNAEGLTNTIQHNKAAEGKHKHKQCAIFQGFTACIRQAEGRRKPRMAYDVQRYDTNRHR